MIKIENGKNIWVTSDSHFSHKNLCRGVSSWKDESGNVPIKRTRDFRDINHMNDTIINNINNCVYQDDVLLHIGDWSFGGFENIKKFRDQITCSNIHLICGNHDLHIKNNKEGIQNIFSSVSELNEIIYDNTLIILCHYPISSWEDLRKGAIMLFGHLHSSTADRFPGEGKIMDVGIDGHPEFRPYHINEIISLMKNRPNVSLITKDHHGKIKVT